MVQYDIQEKNIYICIFYWDTEKKKIVHTLVGHKEV